MRPPGRESRPEADLRAAESFRGDQHSLAPVSDIVVDGAPAHVIFDNRWMAGYELGLIHGLERGIDRGRALADDEAQWSFDLAQQHVHAIAEVEPHDVRWQRATGRVQDAGVADATPGPTSIVSVSGWAVVA